MLNEELNVQLTSKSGNDAKPFVTRSSCRHEWFYIGDKVSQCKKCLKMKKGKAAR